MIKIIYDRETDTFVSIRKYKKNGPESVYLDYNLNKDLHEFLHNINEALKDDYCTITLGEEKLSITRKKITGEVIGCSVPYSVCNTYAHSHWRFIDFYL